MLWRVAVIVGVVVGTRVPAVAPVPAVVPRKFSLRIRPHVGDTLRMRFDQTIKAAGPAADVERAPSRTSGMRVHSRSVVERADSGGTIVLSTTDSVAFDEPGADPRQVASARQAMRGRWVRLRVSPNGAMQLLGAQTRGQAEQALSQLPGTLPETPVAVGATWTREMTLPSIGVAALNQGGRLQVVFRFDSVAREVAFVSMHGALARGTIAQGGARVATTGTMSGQLQVDLRRGWMTSSRADFTMLSTMMPAASNPVGTPMQLRVAISQRLHCAD